MNFPNAGQLQEPFSLTPFPKLRMRGRDPVHVWPDSWQVPWDYGFTEYVNNVRQERERRRRLSVAA